MTQRDMAGYLGIDVKTLRNWRKEKPNLYKIVMLGFEFDQAISEAKEHYEKLKSKKENLMELGL